MSDKIRHDSHVGQDGRIVQISGKEFQAISRVQSFRETGNLLDKTSLVARQLNLHITLVDQRQLVNSTAHECIHHVAAPHQSPAGFFGGCGQAKVRFLTEQICVIFKVDLQGLCHANGEATEHERVRKVSHADCVVMKQDACL